MPKVIQVSNVRSVKIEQFIHIVSVVGLGTHEDICRVVDEYYFMDGKLLYRYDHWLEEKESKE
jgi:hypothetical protein